MMFSFVDRNLPAIELPSTREDWEVRRKELRTEILSIVGLPDLDGRAPVRWIPKGVIPRDTYTIEKILFESYPGMFVPALVYTPRTLARPAPAMVSISGHNYCDSKAGVEVQARSVNLVQRGVIVLAYDYMNTFERNTGLAPCAGMPYGGGNDHALTAFSFTSKTPTALEVMDAVRAIDYLCSRTDVDKNRIGFTGESGGSNSTYWIAALDERVRLAVPVVSVTSFDYWIRNNRNWDWHQRPFGIRRVADIWMLLAMCAPRSMLVIASKRGTDSNEFPIEEAESAVRNAKRIYQLYNATSDLGIWESSTSHGYQQDKRERMYAWVERHFLGGAQESSPERPFQFEPKNSLICGLPPENKTNAQIYREWIEKTNLPSAVPRSKADAEQMQRQFRHDLRRLLGVSAPTFVPKLVVQSVRSTSEVIVRRSTLAVEPGIDLPVVDFCPRFSPSAPIVVVLGRSAGTLGAIEPLIDRGLRPIFLDPRGTGEIDSGGQRTDNWAWFAGKAWLGMWVQDTEALITALETEFGRVPIGLVGGERFGKTALFSAALDNRVTAVKACLEELSYRTEANKGIPADVPGVLSVLDLPELAALVAPRSCSLHFPLRVSEEQIQTAYSWALAFRSQVDGGKRLLSLTRSDHLDWISSAKWFEAQLKIGR